LESAKVNQPNKTAFIEIIILIIGNKQRDPDGPRKCQWYYVQHNICCIYGAKSMKVGGGGPVGGMVGCEWATYGAR